MATALCFARCDVRALRHEGFHSQPVDEGGAFPGCSSGDSRDRPGFIGVEGLLRGLPRRDHRARGARHGVHQAHCREGGSASGPHSDGAPIGGFPWQAGGVRCTLERMVTLAEIESAAAGLSPAEKQELMLFLASRLRDEGAPLPEPRTFMPEEIAGWIHEDEADMRRLREQP